MEHRSSQQMQMSIYGREGSRSRMNGSNNMQICLALALHPLVGQVEIFLAKIVNIFTYSDIYFFT